MALHHVSKTLQSRKLYILPLLLLVLLFSCKSRNAGISDTDEGLYEDDIATMFERMSCIENLQKHVPQQKPGAIKLKIQVDSVHTHTAAFAIDTTFYLKLDKESDFLTFGGQFGLKLFHIEAQEYGNVIHQMKQDFFVYESDCWKRKVSLNYYNVNFNSTSTANSTYFSTGFPGDPNYYKVVYRVLATY
ncbi:MAG: hypothetical protein RLZZ337_1345 [Bacteroidota bacterium]|jgi:hypothetical protein